MNNEAMTNIVNETIESFIRIDNFNPKNVSDWYHTFWELYEHRHHLFIALCDKIIADMNNDAKPYCTVYQVSKSKVHHDWLDVWNKWWMFIIQLETREWQISYHIPNEYWEVCSFIDTLEKANKWDNHTSNDVLQRLLLI